MGEPTNALDIGTGTGIWARDFARKHPRTNVIGTDLSLIQAENDMPPNLTFEREDSEEMWVFDYPFDYIHWRLSKSTTVQALLAMSCKGSMEADWCGGCQCARASTTSRACLRGFMTI